MFELNFISESIDNSIMFMPISNIFYFFAAILPMIFILYTFAHMVYVIGEFKEENRTIPRILMYLIFKIVMTGFMFYSVMNIILSSTVMLNIINLNTIMLMIYGIYIIMETILLNKQLNRIIYKIKLSDNIKHTKKIMLDIYCKNKVLLGFCMFLIMLILVLSVIEIIFDPKFYSLLLLIIFLFSTYSKITFIKYLKSI